MDNTSEVKFFIIQGTWLQYLCCSLSINTCLLTPSHQKRKRETESQNPWYIHWGSLNTSFAFMLWVCEIIWRPGPRVQNQLYHVTEECWTINSFFSCWFSLDNLVPFTYAKIASSSQIISPDEIEPHFSS